ncbi:hypothetical protein DMN91_000467, partial [Ooceraea biroi]
MNGDKRDITFDNAEMPYPRWTARKSWQPVTINV